MDSPTSKQQADITQRIREALEDRPAWSNAEAATRFGALLGQALTEIELQRCPTSEVEHLKHMLEASQADYRYWKERATVEPRDGFTDALAQELYGKDPAAVGCAMMHADDIEGDSTDALALRVLAEEVRRLRATVPPGSRREQK